MASSSAPIESELRASLEAAQQQVDTLTETRAGLEARHASLQAQLDESSRQRLAAISPNAPPQIDFGTLYRARRALMMQTVAASEELLKNGEVILEAMERVLSLQTALVETIEGALEKSEARLAEMQATMDEK